MSQTHSGVSSSVLDLFVNADVYVWWDLISCLPTDCNPFTVVDSIRHAIKGKGYYGRIFIQAYGDIHDYPLSFRMGVSEVFVDNFFRETAWVLNRFCSWALFHPPPATYLLIWDDIGIFSHAIEHLMRRGYNVVIARPCQSSTFAGFNWETLSASSSQFVVAFGPPSIYDVQRVFSHLNRVLGKTRLGANKPCFPSKKWKSTVVIIRVEEISYTSIEYASYYKEKGWKKPAIISIGTPSALDVLRRNAELAGVPFHGCHTESMARDAMERYRKLHDLIIVDTSICIGDDNNLVRCLHKRLIQVYDVVEPDIVLFAVQPAYIVDVDRLSYGYERIGIILVLNEATNYLGRGFLKKFTMASKPIMFFQRGDKFNVFSTEKLVELVLLGVDHITDILDLFTKNMMIAYYMKLKKILLCSRHSEIANGVPTTLSELLIAAYRLWSCKDCSKVISATYPIASNFNALEKRPVFVKVEELTPRTEGHSLRVTVVTTEVILENDVTASPDTEDRRISECLVGDETGVILLTAQKGQVDVMQPRSTVVLRNAKINMLNGFMRLAVDEGGRIEVIEPALFTANEDNNLSLVEYEH